MYTIIKNFEKIIDPNLNSHGTRLSETTIPLRYEREVQIAVHCQDCAMPRLLIWRFRCLQVKTDMSYIFLVPKNSIRGLKNVISGPFSVHLRRNFRQIIFFEHFYSTKRFVFEFQGDTLELFLSYRAHFHRYNHFRGFWQFTVSSYRDC